MFMSTLQLLSESKTHTIEDDLESFFFLVLFLAVFQHRRSYSNTLCNETYFRDIVFAQPLYDPQRKSYIGGQGKSVFLTGMDNTDFEDVVFDDDAPLTVWIRDIYQSFQQFHLNIGQRKLMPKLCLLDSELQIHQKGFMLDHFELYLKNTPPPPKPLKRKQSDSNNSSGDEIEDQGNSKFKKTDDLDYIASHCLQKSATTLDQWSSPHK